MTLDEMKLVVCEKLPELVVMQKIGWWYWKPKTAINSDIYRTRIHWPTEGLQVCHEAEKLLDVPNYKQFLQNLTDEQGTWFAMISSTYEQRLEALCRVWFPERF